MESLKKFPLWHATSAAAHMVFPPHDALPPTRSFPYTSEQRRRRGGGGEAERGYFQFLPWERQSLFRWGFLSCLPPYSVPSSAAYTVYYGTGWVSGSALFFMHEAKVSPSGLDTVP